MLAYRHQSGAGAAEERGRAQVFEHSDFKQVSGMFSGGLSILFRVASPALHPADKQPLDHHILALCAGL